MKLWLIIGLTGQLLFGMRFVIQWICSERKGESYIPIVFWYFSLSGGIVLLAYAIARKDPVFIIGQSMGLVVYIRNLVLIYRKKGATEVDSSGLFADKQEEEVNEVNVAETGTVS